MANIVEMPKLGFDMAEGTLVRWVIREGEPATKGAVLAEIETDKATVEVESGYSGILHHHLVQEGDVVPVGTPIAVIGEAGENIDINSLVGKSLPPSGKGAETEIKKPTEVALSHLTSNAISELEGHIPDGIKATPLARHIAKEQSIDLHTIKGSGPQGRITKHDIEAFSTSTIQTSPSPSVIHAPSADLSASTTDDRNKEIPADKRIPLSRLRTAIGRRMLEARQHIPHFYVTHVYDMAAVMTFREEINQYLDGVGEKISINDFIIQATALTLRKYPNLNASLDGQDIIQHGHIHIGTAVSLDEGLLTVVCRDADQKSLRQISIELHAMTNRARQGKVRPEDIEGSTFSISNLGMFDVEHFIAIINPPEAAILAIGSIQEAPEVHQHEIKIGAHLKATLSVDHRISDGAEAARFLQDLSVYLEHPVRLFL